MNGGLNHVHEYRITLTISPPPKPPKPINPSHLISKYQHDPHGFNRTPQVNRRVWFFSGEKTASPHPFFPPSFSFTPLLNPTFRGKRCPQISSQPRRSALTLFSTTPNFSPSPGPPPPLKNKRRGEKRRGKVPGEDDGEMWMETAIGVVVYEMYSWRGKCSHLVRGKGVWEVRIFLLRQKKRMGK